MGPYPPPPGMNNASSMTGRHRCPAVDK
jgi:hypothetical protein